VARRAPGQRRRRRRLDPDTGEVLPTWDQALDAITDQDQPLHVAQFGSKFDAQGVLAGSRESSRCIGYLTKHLTKYLTKHLGDCRQVATDYQAAHAGRLADALHYEPCPACPARCAARPVSPCPAHKRTPGTEGELAFDSQKTDRNYKLVAAPVAGVTALPVVGVVSVPVAGVVPVPGAGVVPVPGAGVVENPVAGVVTGLSALPLLSGGRWNVVPVLGLTSVNPFSMVVVCWM
jgi:hypothetical protein